MQQILFLESDTVLWTRHSFIEFHVQIISLPQCFIKSTTSPFHQFSLKFLTTATTASPSFTVTYLIDKLGFSPESALKASKYLRFKTSQNSDSVLTFFKNHGFTHSDIQNIIKREPWLLSCDPHKRVLPKFQFLLSKGASTIDIVRMTNSSPRFMQLSLENIVIPTFKSVAQFLNSDQNAVAALVVCPSLISSKFVTDNVKLLADHGVGNASISRIIPANANVIFSIPIELEKILKLLKNMGFDPSKSYFGDALIAMKCLSKSKWDEKINNFKKWGWSDETISEVVMRQPKCMLVSIDKTNRVMEFWINHLGWDDSYLVKCPGILSYSFEKRIIPRASVVQYLLSKGLIRENVSLLKPFFLSEKMFLEKYVECFQEEEIVRLLKLYRGKMNVEGKTTRTGRKYLTGRKFDW